MSDQDSHDLAAAWIEYQRLPKRDAETSHLFSAFGQLYDLVHDQPEAAWPIIQELWTLDQTDRMLAIIAAGPVEDLLCWHGPDFIGRIEQLAGQHAVVRKLLGAVWRRDMAEDVWLRLKAVAGPDF